MKTGLAMATLGLLLAACGGGSAPGDNTATPAALAPMEAKIAALTDAQRKTVFYKAIYDADYECGEIDKIESKPRNDGKPVWVATCDDLGEYVITLQPGGIFTVSGVPQARKRMPKGTKILPVGTK
ncbi:MAG: hypothetical protein E7773_03240 [Sphingomonas sp.]|uniref:hypothetical protein n=1 Tax=Sphingomonas sp. TaxID=28214 RepID=UPI0011F85C3C|nr:hypothetical protein [Sphingomonas sp.]THD38001.1 MAG: hypothetical protein E7773_03240 [Sphingomonas sp.]